MNVLKPHLQTTIWTLLKGGATQREIERITGISRHTIRSYQQRFAADPANCPGVATDSPGQTAPPWPPTGLAVPVPVTTPLPPAHRHALRPVAPGPQRHRHLPGPGRSARFRWRLQLRQTLRGTTAPQGARAVRSPLVCPGRGDAGRLRRGRAHPGARHRALAQTPPVRGHAALLAAQLPPRGLEFRPADLGLPGMSCWTTSRKAS